MATLFPVFLKLQGRKCLVVGGGCIAEQKLGGLLRSRGRRVVVAPQCIALIRARNAFAGSCNGSHANSKRPI